MPPVRPKAALRLLYAIAAVAEPSDSVFCGDSCERFDDGKVEDLLSSSLGTSEKLFELEPGFLDGVQVE